MKKIKRNLKLISKKNRREQSDNMMKDNRGNGILPIILFAAIGLIVGFLIGGPIMSKIRPKVGKTNIANDTAEKKQEKRYLTIINKTGQIINEVHITVGEGSEINKAYQKNPDDESFSIEIPEEYKKYETFNVTLVDRYGSKYEKKVSKAKQNGRTEVKLTEENKVKQKGDLKRSIDKFFNGD